MEINHRDEDADIIRNISWVDLRDILFGIKFSLVLYPNVMRACELAYNLIVNWTNPMDQIEWIAPEYDEKTGQLVFK